MSVDLLFINWGKSMI